MRWLAGLRGRSEAGNIRNARRADEPDNDGLVRIGRFHTGSSVGVDLTYGRNPSESRRKVQERIDL